MFLIALLASASNAAELVVPDDHPTIADALTAASPGDEIVVGPGSWSERLTISKNVTLRSARGQHATTLSVGSGSDPIVTIDSGAAVLMKGFKIDAKQQRGVLVTAAASLEFEDGACVISTTKLGNAGGCMRVDGGGSLSLRRARFQSTGTIEPPGGLLGVENASLLSIEDSHFLQGDSLLVGGAVASFDTPTVQILRSRFTGNSSGDSGGAVYITNASDVEIVDSWFFESSAKGIGGAIFLDNLGGAPFLSHNLFVGNEAISGAAIFLSNATGALLERSLFRSNAAVSGGVLLLECNECEVADSWFEHNTTRAGGLPGGPGVLAMNSEGVKIHRSVFYDNTTPGYGGAVMFRGSENPVVAATLMCRNSAKLAGGALFLSTSTGALVRNSILVGNVGGYGGAVEADNSDTTVLHNTLLHNTATEGGGHIHIGSGSLYLYNSVLAWALRGVAADGDAGNFQSHYSLYWQNVDGDRLNVSSNSDIDGVEPEFQSYSADKDCTNDDWHPIPGGSLWDAGFGAGTDPDGSLPDIGALGGPGMLDVPWWDDADGDGFLASADCNDADPDMHPDTVWYRDTDLDGFGDANISAVGCVPPGVDWVLDDSDCSPKNPTVGGPLPWYLDADGDGFGDPAQVTWACEAPANHVADATDCDDSDSDSFPGQIWYVDADGDSFGADLPLEQCLRPVNGVLDNTDCDDTDDRIHPETVWHEDLDGDTYGNHASTTVACDPGEGWVLDSTDCDDEDSALGPPTPHWPDEDEDDYGDASATPVTICPTEGMVENALDCDDADPGLTPETVWYIDADGDGFGALENTVVQCEAPTNGVLQAGDCDDTRDAVYPGANEVCNGRDDDCDHLIDDEDDSLDLATTTTFYDDSDNDGYGDPSAPLQACVLPAGAADNADDCDDNNGTTYPGAPELCDSVDNNCNVDIDEGLVDLTWYLDTDGDGYGNAADGTTIHCSQPAGYVLEDGDCDETDATIHPNAVEFCDGVDEDCDGTVDNDPEDGLVFYEDADADGFGNLMSPTLACSQPSGYVTNNADCDDTDQFSYPGADELCDGLDNNCNDQVDDDPIDQVEWYPDEDGDGWGDLSRTPMLSCEPAPGYAVGGDCDDTEDGVYPDAEEICDGLDQDCDGEIDEDLPTQTWYADADEDGFGDASVSLEQCDQPEGYVDNPDDCEDSDPTWFPGAPGVGDDCDRAEDPGPDPDPGPEPSDEGTQEEPAAKEGCGCTTAPAPASPAWLALLFLLARRRQSR